MTSLKYSNSGVVSNCLAPISSFLDAGLLSASLPGGWASQRRIAARTARLTTRQAKNGIAGTECWSRAPARGEALPPPGSGVPGRMLS